MTPHPTPEEVECFLRETWEMDWQYRLEEGDEEMLDHNVIADAPLERDLCDIVKEAKKNEPEKRYEVMRLQPLEVAAIVVETYRGNLTRRALDPRLDLWNHSPSGFEFGYGGSGPAQLALALLADALGDDDQAVALHQEFKRRVVANWQQETNHTITAETVRSIAADIRAEHPELLPDPFVEPNADPFADDPPPGATVERVTVTMEELDRVFEEERGVDD